MIKKEPYNRNRKVMQECIDNNLIGSVEWKFAKNYFNVLNCRGQLPYAPSEANGYMCPTYSEVVAHNKDKIDGRATRRPQNEFQVRQAMMEADVEVEKIDRTFEILEQWGKERKE